MRLDPADIEEIARRVADILRADGPSADRGRYVDASTLAEHLGVERDWVYAHARELVPSASAERAGDCASTSTKWCGAFTKPSRSVGDLAGPPGPRALDASWTLSTSSAMTPRLASNPKWPGGAPTPPAVTPGGEVRMRADRTPIRIAID